MVRAEETFAYEVPWYDKEAGWMRIKQGEADGCKYNSAEETDLDTEQFEFIIEQSEEAENNEQQFTFDDEDMFDNEMT